MTYTNTTTTRFALLEFLSGLEEWVREARAKRRIYNQTVSELSRLSDRDLDDLGIARLSIEDIARQHAYGA
jgi:uncharacterized protein YjiS (DUF1127 family)